MAQINHEDVIWRFLCCAGDQTKFDLVDTALDAGVTLDDILGIVSTGGAVNIQADSTWAEGVDIALGTVTGSKISTAAGQKIAFHGATPIVQAALISIPAAITGGEAPTEAEHNLLRTAVASINTVLVNLGLTAAA